ncbi:MAG: hypothetical protein R3C99_09560 [Pirellulaceae bacterium]
MSDVAHDYESGPTTCPTPKVIKSIKQQIRANHAFIVRGDILIGDGDGLVASDSVRPLGFNDGLVYPVEAGPH